MIIIRIFWRWLLRPLIVAMLGVSAMEATDESPEMGCMLGIVSVLLAFFLILDLIRIMTELGWI